MIRSADTKNHEVAKAMVSGTTGYSEVAAACQATFLLPA